MKAKTETKKCVTCGATFTTITRQVECTDCISKKYELDWQPVTFDQIVREVTNRRNRRTR